MSKQIIVLDFDNVICDDHYVYPLNQYLEKTGRKPFGTIYKHNGEGGKPNRENFTDDEDMREFFKFFLSDSTYRGTKPLPGAIEGVAELCKHYEVYIVTAISQTREHAREYADKFHWMLDKMPFFNPRKIIMANDKSVINADIIVDDRIRNLTDNYKTKILFSAYHNAEIKQSVLDKIGVERISGWKDLLKRLLPAK